MERSKKEKEEVAILKTGPTPIITNEMKEYLKSWIIGIQRNGVTISRDMIIAKGNGIYRLMYRTTISTGFLG